MSFDDLFGLLLFVVFIALPALSRMASKKNPGGGASPSQGAPSQGAPTQGAPGPGRASTAQPTRTAAPATGGTATASGGGDELERRLAEARERVRRALEGQSGSSSSTQSPAKPSTPAPAARTTRPAATVRRGKFVSVDRDDGLLSTPLDPSTAGFLGPKRAAERTRPRRFDEAPALQVERPGVRPAGRTADSSAPFRTDPDTIRAALVWHQVLGEPRAKRPLGGKSSTLRSR